jgi:hypothetical protein
MLSAINETMPTAKKGLCKHNETLSRQKSKLNEQRQRLSYDVHGIKKKKTEVVH